MNAYNMTKEEEEMERISHMDMTKPAIEMREIVKKFGDFTANDHVNLLVHKGEVHAILGENGAGKSTLMNVLYGLYQPTSGQIFVGGKEEVIHSPSRAIELGIGMVHQHFMLVSAFTVADNIIAGSEPCKGIFVDRRKEYETIEDDIAALETRLGEIDGEMASCARDFVKLNELTEEKTQLETQLEEKMDRWTYLEELAAKILQQNA